VVTVPGLGDSIQVIKAGITEIADIFVVNKGDYPGADGTVTELELMLDMTEQDDWKIPVVKTTAKKGLGVPELKEQISDHMTYLSASGMLAQRRGKRYENELLASIKKKLMALILDESKLKGTIEDMIDRISKREKDPHSAADEILEKLLK
jgi:LAO/AO transport system kinase